MVCIPSSQWKIPGLIPLLISFLDWCTCEFFQELLDYMKSTILFLGTHFYCEKQRLQRKHISALESAFYSAWAFLLNYSFLRFYWQETSGPAPGKSLQLFLRTDMQHVCNQPAVASVNCYLHRNQSPAVYSGKFHLTFGKNHRQVQHGGRMEVFTIEVTLTALRVLPSSPPILSQTHFTQRYILTESLLIFQFAENYK